MAEETIRIKGLAELNRAFGQLDKTLQKSLRAELLAAAEPVRSEAEQLAAGFGGRWSRMRSGGSARTAYVAPRARRQRGTPRPNFAPLILSRAMQPALERRATSVMARLEQFVDRAADRAGF